MNKEKQTSDNEQVHAPLGDVDTSSFIEVIRRHGYPSQPWVDNTLYMAHCNGIRLDFRITESMATVWPGGYGSCQSLIAKTPEELDQNIQAWIRHR